MKLDTQSALHGLFLEGVRVAVKAGDHTADHSTQVGEKNTVRIVSLPVFHEWREPTERKRRKDEVQCQKWLNILMRVNQQPWVWPESDPDHFLSFLDAWPVIYAAYHQIQALLNRPWKFYLRAIYWVCTSEPIFYCVAVLMLVWQSPTLVFEPPTVYVPHYYVFFSDDWKDSLSHTL